MKKRTPEGARLTELLVTIVQAVPAIERIGHRLGQPSSLTFAAWQVASVLGEAEATVPQLAKLLSRRRQTVQVAVDELVRGGHATKVENPRHARSPKIKLTPQGITAFWDTAARVHPSPAATKVHEPRVHLMLHRMRLVSRGA